MALGRRGSEPAAAATAAKHAAAVKLAAAATVKQSAAAVRQGLFVGEVSAWELEGSGKRQQQMGAPLGQWGQWGG